MTYKNNRNQNNDREPVSGRDGSLSRCPGANSGRDERPADSHEALENVRRILEQGTEIGKMLRRDPDVQKARETAIVYISRRPQTSGRVRDKLVEKGFDEDLAFEVTGSLIRDGYIDDRKFARQLISERQGRKSESYFALEKRLVQAGVPRHIAADALAEARTSRSETVMLADFLKSKFRKELIILRDRNPGPDEARKLAVRLCRAAEGRGFSGAEASRLLTRWGLETYM